MTAFWKFVEGEWYFAVPMLGLSFVAFTLLFWRLLLNLDARTPLGEFLPQLKEQLARGGVEAAQRFCRARHGIIPRQLCTAGLAAAAAGPNAMRRAMAEALHHTILPELNFLLPPILAIAKIATMIGLLGTVVSMIHTFNALSEAEGSATAAVHAGAIGLALFATALGLMIAIPLVFAHVLLKAWVRRFELRLRHTAEKLVELVFPEPEHDGAAMADEEVPGYNAPGGVPSEAPRPEES